MGMRSANIYLSPCEIIREINDLCQSDSDKDLQIRKRCHKLERMNKAMSDKVHEIDPKYSHSWPERNDNEADDWKLRIDRNYKVDK